jgi:pimeloyl-ACP methyl ester carboxylesterase
LKRRPKGVLEIGWAVMEAAWTGRREHLPHWAEYPDALVERIGFRAGGGFEWRLSALRTPRARPAPWKIVVVTGAPSWAEYWSAALASVGPEREMWVVDRPGFGSSEPAECVPDLAVQTAALGPLLDCAPGQRVVLVGQSYGAAIAALMAAAQPDKVGALVLLSGLFGEMGPTAAGLVDLGRRVHGVIPRDLRNAITEVRAQPPQLLVVREALSRLSMPIHIVHGEEDDFAPIAAARALAQSLEAQADIRFAAVPGADHFLNEGPPELLLAHLEAAIASATPEPEPPPSLAQRLRGWLTGRKASLVALAERTPRRAPRGAQAAADR